MIFEISLVIQQFYYFYWVYLTEEFDKLLLKNINYHLFRKNLTAPRQVLAYLGDNSMLIVSALTLVSAAFIIFINVRNEKNRSGCSADENIGADNVMTKAANVRTAFVALYVVCGLLIRLVL